MIVFAKEMFLRVWGDAFPVCLQWMQTTYVAAALCSWLTAVSEDFLRMQQGEKDPMSVASIGVREFTNLYKTRVSSVAVKLGSLPRDDNER